MIAGARCSFRTPFRGALCFLGLGLLLGGCGSAPADHDVFLDHQPRSILVLPPLNRSTEVEAPYAYLSTVTRPLAERGYYVFPVAVVDAMMKENGLPTPGEMHQVSPAKIDEIIGPDAILYITITRWGTAYRVIDSSTVVEVRCRLVDTKTGLTLWSGKRRSTRSSSSGGQGILGAVIGALVHQVASAISNPTRDLAQGLSRDLFQERSLLLGPRNPGAMEQRRRLLREREERRNKDG